jgi:hypothetical protein
MALTKPRAYQIYDIDYKQAVRVVSTTNITLGGGAPNSVDGVTLNQNDRVLVTGQTGKAQNGIYYVTTVGSGSNGTWARSVDANTTGEVLAGMIVMVTEGGQYADTQWKLLTDDPITIGSTELTFAQNYGVPYTAASIPPTANVVVGSQWFNTDTNILYEYLYDGTSYYWIDQTGPAIAISGGSISGGGNGITYTANTSPPATANVADQWFNTSSGALYEYQNDGTSNYWIDVTGPTVANISTITATQIINGTSNVSINTTNGNITMGVAGTSDVVTISNNSLSVVGNVSATYFIGNGSQLTGISASGGAGNARVMGYSLVFGG